MAPPFYISLADRITSRLSKWYMLAKPAIYENVVRNLPPVQLCARSWTRRAIVKNSLYPAKIYLETINQCNAQCVFCPIKTEMKRKRGLMPMELFKKLVDEISLNQRRVRQIFLHMHGEPFLDPHIVERVAYVKRKKLENLILVTNGSKLDEDTAKALVSYGLDAIVFSMEGVDKEGFEKTRPPLNFDAVRDNILNLIKIRLENGKRKPYVVMRYVKTPENKFMIDEYFKYWQKKVSAFSVFNVHSWNNQITRHGEAEKSNLFPCYMIFDSMIILNDGKVAACCLDLNASKPMGDVGERSIGDVWRGKAFAVLRRKHLENEPIAMCDKCDLRNNATNKPFLWKTY